MEDLIAAVRRQIADHCPRLSSVFETYAQEAKVSRAIIDTTVRSLPKGARILEVGSGLGLVSCQLQREGFVVTALEPVGAGFSHFNQLQRIVFDHSASQGFSPELLAQPAEELRREGVYDLAFSFNVMEHVSDVKHVLRRVVAALKPRGSYRFICPNYAFPYEPHFNIMTLGSKAITERFRRRRIMASTVVIDPEGTWESLNWITESKVRRFCKELDCIVVGFDPSIMDIFFRRATDDACFKQRRGVLLSALLKLLSGTGILRTVSLVPSRFLPVMDCTVSRL